jgi:hypothetical protein
METFARQDDLIWRQPDMETFARLEDQIWRQPDMETFVRLEDLIWRQNIGCLDRLNNNQPCLAVTNRLHDQCFRLHLYY